MENFAKRKKKLFIQSHKKINKNELKIIHLNNSINSVWHFGNRNLMKITAYLCGFSENSLKNDLLSKAHVNMNCIYL
jgi:hypothetical protein